MRAVVNATGAEVSLLLLLVIVVVVAGGGIVQSDRRSSRVRDVGDQLGRNFERLRAIPRFRFSHHRPSLSWPARVNKRSPRGYGR